MNYKLLAMDMDGTLLNYKKEVTPAVRAALDDAAAAGKVLAFATGRAVDELLPYRGDLAAVRYAIAESGALLFDRKEEKILHRMTFSAEQAAAVMKIAGMEDISVQAFSEGRNNLPEKMMADIARYHMEPYKEQYETCARTVPDMEAFVLSRPAEFEKLSLYHTDTAARERSLKRLVDAGLCAAPENGSTASSGDGKLEMCYAEVTSIELSPTGAHKGAGLLALCKLLGIGQEETMAIGDNANDTMLLLTCALPLAVGNAIPEIKSIAKHVVADHEHDGCAEAIRTYLLGGC